MNIKHIKGIKTVNSNRILFYLLQTSMENGGCRDWRENGELLFNGTSLFCKMKRSADGWWSNNVNTFTTTELYT